jgi:hypothetical protein
MRSGWTHREKMLPSHNFLHCPSACITTSRRCTKNQGCIQAVSSQRSNSDATQGKATVKQRVAFLDLPTVEDISVPVESSTQLASDFVTRLDFDYPQLFHCKIGTALVTYKDQTWFTNTQESPAQTLLIEQAPLGPYVIYSEASSIEHSIKSVHPQLDMLVDTGSTITTMGTNDELSSYVKPSTSGIKMRSATGQIVLPAGEGDITLQAEQASFVLKCQLTPALG